MARSLEKMLNSDRRLCMRDALEWNPLDDIRKLLSLETVSFRDAPGLPSPCDSRDDLYSMRYDRSLPRTKVLAPRLSCPESRLYWITTFFCCVFTPPLESCAV